MNRRAAWIYTLGGAVVVGALSSALPSGPADGEVGGRAAAVPTPWEERSRQVLRRIRFSQAVTARLIAGEVTVAEAAAADRRSGDEAYRRHVRQAFPAGSDDEAFRRKALHFAAVALQGRADRDAVLARLAAEAALPAVTGCGNDGGE